jgi:putative holliday junction resolvase
MASADSAAPHILLAFDFGTRRIGVATGDTLTRTARALTTLTVHSEFPWTSVDQLLAEYHPQQLVVGLPYNMDGTPTTLTETSRAFGQQLKAKYRLPVAMVDERLSSREAEAALREARASGLKRKRTTHADIDMIAARILLERWFDNPQAAENL